MKLQCFNCEGKLTWFTEYAKSQDFENVFKGFSTARHEVRDYCCHCLVGCGVSYSALGFDVITCCRRHGDAELRAQEEC